jgi:hypothetical protein
MLLKEWLVTENFYFFYTFSPLEAKAKSTPNPSESNKCPASRRFWEIFLSCDQLELNLYVFF